MEIFKLYSDFEETITLPYKYQSTTLDQIIAASLPENTRTIYLENFYNARQSYLHDKSEHSFRKYFRALGIGILSNNHLLTLAHSWSLNPNFISTIKKILKIINVRSIHITIVGRGFTQPFQYFLKREDIKSILSELYIDAKNIHYFTNTLVFDENGLYTGNVESPIIIDKAQYVPSGMFFLGDDRDQSYGFSNFINVNYAKNRDHLVDLLKIFQNIY